MKRNASLEHYDLIIVIQMYYYYCNHNTRILLMHWSVIDPAAFIAFKLQYLASKVFKERSIVMHPLYNE